MRSLSRLIFILWALNLTGCAIVREINETQEQREQRRAERAAAQAEEQANIDRMFDGWTEDQIMEKYGAPTKIETAGSNRIFYYYEDHGSTGKTSGAVFAYSSFGNTTVTNHYVKRTFFFKDGRVTKWDYDGQ